jgi:hypothetical protein
MHMVSYFVSGTKKMMRTNYKYLAVRKKNFCCNDKLLIFAIPKPTNSSLAQLVRASDC